MKLVGIYTILMTMLIGCGLEIVNRSSSQGQRETTDPYTQILREYFSEKLDKLLETHPIDGHRLTILNAKAGQTFWPDRDEAISGDEIPLYLGKIDEARKSLDYSFEDDRVGATGELYLIFSQLQLITRAPKSKIKDNLPLLTEHFERFLDCTENERACFVNLSLDLKNTVDQAL